MNGGNVAPRARTSMRCSGLAASFPIPEKGRDREAGSREHGASEDPHPNSFRGRERTRVGAGSLALQVLTLTTIAILAVASPALAAGDATAGRRKALACQTCHGLDGLSKLPEAPHLAGQPEPYLVKSLDDYRTGARKNDMMSLVAKPLSDQDIADLAAYFSAIEIEVKPPAR